MALNGEILNEENAWRGLRSVGPKGANGGRGAGRELCGGGHELRYVSGDDRDLKIGFLNSLSRGARDENQQEARDRGRQTTDGIHGQGAGWRGLNCRSLGWNGDL